MAILAIDPGAKGGIAWVSDDNAMAWKMPDTPRDLWDLVYDLARKSDRAVIERVHATPGGGNKDDDGNKTRKMGAKSAFAFGRSFGELRMILTACSALLELPYTDVSPGVWQRPFSLPTVKAAGTQTAKKNAHKARAQELFPALRITHATADCLLIAEWLRRRCASEVAA